MAVTFARDGDGEASKSKVKSVSGSQKSCPTLLFVILIIGLLFCMAFLLGLFKGGQRFHWIAGGDIDVVWHRWWTRRNLAEVMKLAKELSDVSWRDDVESCRYVLSKIRRESSNIYVKIQDVRQVAVELEEDDKYMEALVLHHMTFMIIRNSASMHNASITQNQFLETLFLAKQSIRPLHYRIYALEKRRIRCAMHLWTYFINDIITVHVDDHGGETVISNAWYNLSGAIACADFQNWEGAWGLSHEVIQALQDQYDEYGANSSPERFEVYGWAALVIEVAYYKNEKGIPVDGGGGWAVSALNKSTDRIIKYDFQKTMFRLFPYHTMTSSVILRTVD